MKMGKGGFGKPIQEIVEDPVMSVEADSDDGGPPDGVGKPDDAGGGGRPSDAGGMGGRPGEPGTMKGELYGDQIVVLRDLDPTDGGGDGEPLLDGNDQMIVVGYDPDGLMWPDDADHLVPIYFEVVAGEEDDFEIPAEFLPYVQEVELERANVARAPDRVMEQALDAAYEKLVTADELKVGLGGRLMYSTDGGVTFATIDAPLENLGLYQALMTAGPDNSWTSVQENWDSVMIGDTPVDLSFLADIEGFDPSALLAGAWSKFGEITLDAMIYEHTTLGINEVTGSGATLNIDNFSFNDGVTETYDYDRSDAYGDVTIGWWELGFDPDGEPTATYHEDTILNAVFGGEDWGDAEDVYLALNAAGDDFIYADASHSGVNDFAQAADDSLQVIEFTHEFDAWIVETTEMVDAA